MPQSYDPQSVQTRVDGYHDKLDAFKDGMSSLNSATSSALGSNTGAGLGGSGTGGGGTGTGGTGTGGTGTDGTGTGGGTTAGGVIQFVRGTTTFLSARTFADGEPGLVLDDFDYPRLVVKTTNGLKPLSVRASDITGLSAIIAAGVTTDQLTAALVGRVTSGELATALSDKVTTGQLTSALSDKITSSQLDAAMADKVTDGELAAALADVATTTQLAKKLDAPTTPGTAGKILGLDGNLKEVWTDAPSSIPTQTGFSGKFLTTDGTTLSWSNTPIYFSNPMTATGDLILGISGGGGSRLPIGTAGQVLTVVGGTASWQSPASPFPSMAGNSGKVLTNNGSTVTWTTIDAFPSQTGQSGKFLTTNGSATSWTTVAVVPDVTSQSGKFLTNNGTVASWASLPSQFPTQTGNSGKFLKTDGTNVAWATVDAFPTQTGKSGKFLTTDGTTVAWSDVPSPIPAQSTNDGKFLTTDGTNLFWATVSAASTLPGQTGNSGKFLTTNGSTVSWSDFPFSNPMTAQGDMIYGGLSGAMTRIPAGVNGSVLQIVSGVPSWTTGVILPPVIGNPGKFLMTDGSSAYWAAVPVTLPSMTGNSGKVLSTDGTNASWVSFPTEVASQTGNSGKFLTTNGTSTSWSSLPSQFPTQTGNSGKFLSTDGSTVTWEAPPSGFANPMTAVGDIIVGSTGGAATALPIGSSGYFLSVSGGTPAWVAISQVPAQATHSGKFLTTNGTTASWTMISQVPTQTGQAGKYLYTDGTNASWVQAIPTMTGQSGKVLSTDGTQTIWAPVGNLYPSQTGNSGKFLTTDGTNVSWAEAGGAGASLPAQTGNAGKLLTTDGTNASWVQAIPTMTGQSGKVLSTDGTQTIWAPVGNLYPSQTGNAGLFLTTDGTNVSWAAAGGAGASLPSQTGNSGKFLYTDGTNANWVTPPTGIPTMTGNAKKFLTTDGTNASWSTLPFLNPMTTANDIIVGGASGAAKRLAAGSVGQVLQILSGGAVGYGAVPTHTHKWTDLSTGAPYASSSSAGLIKIGDTLTVDAQGRLNTLAPAAPTSPSVLAKDQGMTTTSLGPGWSGRTIQSTILASSITGAYSSFRLKLQVTTGTLDLSSLKLYRCSQGTKGVLSSQDVAIAGVVASSGSPLSLASGIYWSDTIAMPLSQSDSDYYLLATCPSTTNNNGADVGVWVGVSSDGYCLSTSSTPVDALVPASVGVRALLREVWGQQTLPVATNSTLGLVKVGTGLSMDANGILSVTAAQSDNAGRNAYVTPLGDGTNRTLDITHNLGSRDVAVTLWDTSGNYGMVDAEIRSLNANQVRVVTSDALPAPAIAGLRAVVLKGGTTEGTKIGNFTHKMMATCTSATEGFQLLRALIYTLNMKNGGADIRVYACTSEGVIYGDALPIAVSAGMGYYSIAWQTTMSVGTPKTFMIFYGDTYLDYMRLPQSTLATLMGAINAPMSGSSVVLTGPQYAYVPSASDWGTAGTQISGTVDTNVTVVTGLPPWTYDGAWGTELRLSADGVFGISNANRTSPVTAGTGYNNSTYGADAFLANVRDMEQKFIRKVMLTDGWYFQIQSAYWSNRDGYLKFTIRYKTDGTMTFTWFDTSSDQAGPYTVDNYTNSVKTSVSSATRPVITDPNTALCIKVVPTTGVTVSLGPEVAL